MKRIIALILALTTLLTLCFLTSCSKDEEGTGDKTAEATGENAGNQDMNDADLPESDFDGYNFRILTRSEHQYWSPADICSHELTGDVLNDAVYKRTTFIEEKYNIKLTQIMEDDYLGEARAAVLADDDRYDVVCIDIWRSAQLAKENLLVDYVNVPNVDFTKDCWDQSIQKDITIANQQFFALGDINYVDNNATWCVLFNKRLYADLDLGNAYEDVENHEWTMDKMYEICKNSTSDLNGDSELTYDADRWGAVGEYANVSAFMAGMGIRYVQKNSDDVPEYNLDNPKAVEAFEKVYTFMHDPQTMVRADDYTMDDHWNVVNVNTFKGGRAVYYTCPMTHVVQMRDMEDDYGILPLPLYDDKQETYYTTIQPLNATAYTIPKTNRDLSRTGIILQAMASASDATITPAYYDVTLERRSTRDEESKAMLDIIFANRILDISNMFDWANIRTGIEDVVRQDSNTYVSTVDSLKSSLLTAMNDTLTIFENQR